MPCHEAVTIEEGSMNVYAELNYANAGEIRRKSKLAT
jgi:hypothetical protein